jgi:ferredoxin-like protein FixX
MDNPLPERLAVPAWVYVTQLAFSMIFTFLNCMSCGYVKLASDANPGAFFENGSYNHYLG